MNDMQTSPINWKIADVNDFVSKIVSDKYCDTAATRIANSPIKARCDRMPRECQLFCLRSKPCFSYGHNAWLLDLL